MIILPLYVCTLSESKLDRYSHRMDVHEHLMGSLRHTKTGIGHFPRRKRTSHHDGKRLTSAAAGSAAQPAGNATQPAEYSSSIPPLPPQLAAQSRPPPSRCPAVDQFVATIRAPVGMPCLIFDWHCITQLHILSVRSRCTAQHHARLRLGRPPDARSGQAWTMQVVWRKIAILALRRTASEVR